MSSAEPAWSWWRTKLGSPQHVLSPMVDQSELAFRLLCREIYNEGISDLDNKPGLLCYTPMIHSDVFVNDKTYRNQRFSTCEMEQNDRGGLIAQFCGHSPDNLVEAARLIQDKVDAVDLNIGCPENIAMKGHYGAFLLRETDLLTEIVSRWKKELDIPCTCKIRLLDGRHPEEGLRGLQGTINLCKSLEAAGASAICVHGRTRGEKGTKTGADWESIKKIKEVVGIPVIANGGIETFDDITRCQLLTNADAVMSAEAVLENPYLFSPNSSYKPDTLDVFKVCERYLELATIYPPPNFNQTIKAHCMKFLYSTLKALDKSGQNAKQLVEKLMGSSNIQELRECITLLQTLLGEENVLKSFNAANKSEPTSWYRRHRTMISKGHQALKDERRRNFRAMGYKV